MIDDQVHNVTIENSFTFKIKNTTNYAQTITLFREGTDTQNDVKVCFSTGQTTSLNNLSPLFPFSTWNNPLTQPFYFFAPATTILTSYPTINDIYINFTGLIYLVSNNETSPSVFSLLSVPVSIGENFDVVNDRINQYLRDFSDTTNFRNSAGDVMVFNFVFDFSIFQQSPLPINLANYTDPYGISVQYPITNGQVSPYKLMDIYTDLNLSFATYGKVDGCDLRLTSSANGVEVIDIANLTYAEVKQSQNGGILDIQSLTLNIGNVQSITERQSQMLQPFIFKKKDVNGNEVDFVKSQLIDPYQDQYSYSIIDLVSYGEQFVLDGNTRFTYNVEPQISFNITWNYIQIKNSEYQSQEGAIEIDVNKRNTEQLNADGEYASKILLTSNYVPHTKKVSNKTNHFVPLLLGAIALYLMFNLKTNQQ